MGYIVNNCPGIYKSGNKPALCVEHNYRCDLVDDCVIKDIINEQKKYAGMEYPDAFLRGKIHTAKSILAKFDIEEVG